MGEGLRQQLSSALSLADQHKAQGQAFALRASEMRALLGTLLDHIAAQGTGLGTVTGTGTGLGLTQSVLPPAPVLTVDDNLVAITDTTTSVTGVGSAAGSIAGASAVAGTGLLVVEQAAVAAAKGQVTALAQGLADVARGKQVIRIEKGDDGADS